MNERINELAEQADAFDDAMDVGGKSYIGLRDEYFAKLIVQECIGIAQDRAAFDWAPPNDVNHIINEIKQHFGVE